MTRTEAGQRLQRVTTLEALGYNVDSISAAGAISSTALDMTVWPDDREIGGMRVPHRYIESSEMGGRTIYQAERIQVGVELAPDTFTLEPSVAPRRGR